MDAIADATKATRLTHRETLLIVLGMLLPIFMGSLDQTILASALPTIGRDLDDAHDLPWLITAYLLASTAIIPLYGKIADIHGRAVRAAHRDRGSYLAGSLVCALAPSMLVLILGRALQGIGGGGLSSMGMVVLGDLVARRASAGATTAISPSPTPRPVACGPVLGGFLADHLHWSAIFWLNIPLGLAALAVTSTLLRGLPRHERPHRLDVIGAALIVARERRFHARPQPGGRPVSLDARCRSWRCFAFALIVAALFVLRLMTAPGAADPDLGSARIRWCAAPSWPMPSAGARSSGSTSSCRATCRPSWGSSPRDAGLSLMVLMVALNISAGLAGQVLGRVAHYKALPMAGARRHDRGGRDAGMAGGTASTCSEFEILLILIGAGFGPLPSLTQVAVQNMVARHQLGISLGTMNFLRNLFATILVAAFGAIVLAGTVAGQPLDSALQAGISATAFGRVFFVAAASMSIALIAIVLMEEKPLQTGAELDAQ